MSKRSTKLWGLLYTSICLQRPHWVSTPMSKYHTGRHKIPVLCSGSTKSEYNIHLSEFCDDVKSHRQTQGKTFPYLFSQCQPIYARSLVPLQGKYNQLVFLPCHAVLMITAR